MPTPERHHLYVCSMFSHSQTPTGGGGGGDGGSGVSHGRETAARVPVSHRAADFESFFFFFTFFPPFAHEEEGGSSLELRAGASCGRGIRRNCPTTGLISGTLPLMKVSSSHLSSPPQRRASARAGNCSGMSPALKGQAAQYHTGELLYGRCASHI